MPWAARDTSASKGVRSRRGNDRDLRDWRSPLEKPPFGEPIWSQQCSKCDLYYPYQSFHRPARAGHRQPRYRLCLNCRDPR